MRERDRAGEGGRERGRERERGIEGGSGIHTYTSMTNVTHID